MPRSFAFLILLLISIAMTGCGDRNIDAPLDTQAHPGSWLTSHAEDAALSSPEYTECTSCHGPELTGGDGAPSCYSCHSFNTAPPFTVHAAHWTDPYESHRGSKVATSCANCHGSALEGSVAAPSCFSTTFEGRGCHAAGPGLAPHPLDTTYLAGGLHGPDAKRDLTVCQGCHGEPGGPGDNPRFNVGIDSQGGIGCEACHGIYYAHPANWEGYSGPTSHHTSGNIPYACSLCHGAALDGGIGVSCGDCHTLPLTFD